MAKNSNQFIIIQKRRKSNKVFLAFLGILGFIAIYVPFFGSNLRYMTGTAFKLIFTNVGNFCLIVGGALLAINILKVFGKKIDIKGFLVSILLLWIGAFLTGAPFEIMGFLFGGSQPPQGYHFF
jgi:peptidoglycan/LPS O-acetylase OafA/YrhL